MSLIYGVNLADRIYLAADCRLTRHRKTESGELVVSYLDNINKIEYLTDDMFVAAAGSAQLAHYLINELKKESFIKNGITEVRRQIKDWVGGKVSNYLEKHEYAEGAFVFGGIDSTSRKQINGKKLIELVKNFQDSRNVSMEMKDVILQGLKSSAKGPNQENILPAANSILFSIYTDTQFCLELEDAEWGECLAFGPRGFKREDIPKTLFGQLEFEQGCGNPFKDAGILTAFIKSTANVKKLSSVGGSVIVMILNEEYKNGLISNVVHRLDPKTGKQVIVSETEVHNGRLYARTESGIMVPLIPLANYQYKNGEYKL